MAALPASVSFLCSSDPASIRRARPPPHAQSATADALLHTRRVGGSAARLSSPDRSPRRALDDARARGGGSPALDAFMAAMAAAPLDAYALAGAHDQPELARAASARLLSLSLSDISAAHAERMGAVYLRRLVALHHHRVNALQRLIVTGPVAHAPAPTCAPDRQHELERAWMDAAVFLGSDARADTSAEEVSAAFAPVADSLECSQCQDAVRHRLKILLHHWSLVKTTI